MVRPFTCLVLFALAALSVGCGGSPSSPTPPPSAAAQPAPAAPAGLTLRLVSPSAGPTIGGDSIRIFGGGFQAGVTVTIDDAAVAVIRMAAAFIEVRTLAHAAGTVDLVVTNPGGESRMLAASYSFATFSVAADPAAVEPGGRVTVSWTAPSGRTCEGGGDWIAIYKVGDPDDTGAANGHSDLWYEHLCGAPSGSWTLSAPAEPGEYEFRYLAGAGSVARSNPVTVG